MGTGVLLEGNAQALAKRFSPIPHNARFSCAEAVAILCYCLSAASNAKRRRCRGQSASACYAFPATTVVLKPSSGVGTTKCFVTSSNISLVSVAALSGCSVRLFSICIMQTSSGWSM